MVLIRSRCVFIIRDEDRKRGLKAKALQTHGVRENEQRVRADTFFKGSQTKDRLVNKHDLTNIKCIYRQVHVALGNTHGKYSIKHDPDHPEFLKAVQFK